MLRQTNETSKINYLYGRLSDEDEQIGDSNSIENQRAYLDDFIKKMPEFAGCEVHEALDDGRTGTNLVRVR